MSPVVVSTPPLLSLPFCPLTAFFAQHSSLWPEQVLTIRSSADMGKYGGAVLALVKAHRISQQ